MSVKVSEGSSSGDFKLPEPATYLARCVQLIDIGTQYSEHYRKSAHKITFGFELLGETRDDGEPMLVFHRFTASLHKNAALRASLESWRAKPFTPEELGSFDLVKVLGAPCYINIVHSDDGKWANVKSIMALPKGTTAPPALSETLLFDIDNPDMTVYEKFGDKMKAIIEASEEWGARTGKQTGDSHEAPPTPFDDNEPPF